MPDDHPLKELFALTGSPANAVLDALLSVIIFPLAYFGAVKQVPAILSEELVNTLNSRYPNIPLSPAIVANLTQTSYKPPENLWYQTYDPEQEASYSGTNARAWTP